VPLWNPRIEERLIQEIAVARSQPDVELIVLDAALLLEAGWRHLCDRVVYVDVPDELRSERVKASRGWSLEQLDAREQSQYPLDRKRKEADDVIDNSRSGAHALSQLEAIVSQLVSHEPS
jgi:dephospho-CoA kinase